MPDSKQIHALRKHLLHSGYTPLPLLDKGIRIKNWTRDTIDDDWLDQYARTSRFANTGIRCDNLVAFDIDVLDEDLADDCERAITKCVGRTDLCRVGKWPKRLLLYRLDGEPMRSARTAKYSGHMVEVLASRKRQFAAFGIHPGTGEPYEWLDGYSPETVQADDLPAVTVDDVERALNECIHLFETAGLELQSAGYAIDHHDELDDLDDHFAIHLVSGAAVTWSELKPHLTEKGAWGNITREDGQFGDSGAVHFYLSNTSQEPIAYDFARDVLHREPVIDDAALDDLELPDDAASLFDEPLEGLLQQYALIGDGTVRMIDQPDAVWRYPNFKLLNSNLIVPVQLKTKTVMKEAVEIWKAHPKCVTAHTIELRPEAPDRAIIHEGDLRIFNLYNPPLHPERGGEVDTILEFIAHLVPDQAEREIFLDWHAMKVARPELPMHGLVMVTPEFGTGRGTWLQVLSRLFGHHYVARVELHQLIGQGGQADYNDFRADSLIIEVPEALEEKEDITRYKVRHVAYERIKNICEPQPTRVKIQRKYGVNNFQKIHSSLIICSNHSDALAIPPGDRRLIILRNTETRLVDAPARLRERVFAWMDEPSNIGALQRYLLDRALTCTYDPLGDPPMTIAKQQMVDESESDMDLMWHAFVDQAEGELCTPQQWRAFANARRYADHYDVPSNFDGACNVILQERGRRIASIGKKQIKIDGAPYRVWILRNFDHWERRAGNSLNAEIRVEVLKNGNPAGDDYNVTGIFSGID